MNCMKCQKEIVETTISENGSGSRKLGEGQKFLHNGKNEYVLCPYCGAKNICGDEPSPFKGAIRTKFIRYEE